MDKKNAIVPKTVESEPNVAEPSIEEAFDGMAQQLAGLTAEVFHVKTVLLNGVAYLNTCADQEPSLSAAEYTRGRCTCGHSLLLVPVLRPARAQRGGPRG